MGKNTGGHGYIIVALNSEGIEAIADAVVRKLREGGLLLTKEDRCRSHNDQPAREEYRDRPYMTEKEAAAYLAHKGYSVSAKTLQKQRVRGDGLPFVKFKSRVRYRKQDVDAWLDSTQARKSTSDQGGM